ncbi:4163_t:CDS:2 [Funneliformis geosporum]|nr:4163_t:CDS:2 [Funneliformis geosporum]
MKWPVENSEAGCILARTLSRTGLCHSFSPEKIAKLIKNPIKKPQPISSNHTNSTKLWTVPIPRISDKENIPLTLPNNKNIPIENTSELECVIETKSCQVFFAGWVLKEYQKSYNKRDKKPITEQTKITRTASSFKIHMSERALEEAEGSGNA